MHGLQVWRQFRAVLADLLRVEVAHLLGHVNHVLHLLVVALLGALGRDAPGAADLSAFGNSREISLNGGSPDLVSSQNLHRHSKIHSK